METFALGAMFWLMEPHGGDFVDMRVPAGDIHSCRLAARRHAARRGGAAGLTQAERTARLEEVRTRTEILKTRKRVTCLREALTTIPRDDYECADCGLPLTPGRKPV
jgi:5-methylcytosine-specific restriction endonuclease McrA